MCDTPLASRALGNNVLWSLVWRPPVEVLSRPWSWDAGNLTQPLPWSAQAVSTSVKSCSPDFKIIAVWPQWSVCSCPLLALAPGHLLRWLLGMGCRVGPKSPSSSLWIAPSWWPGFLGSSQDSAWPSSLLCSSAGNQPLARPLRGKSKRAV